MLTGAILGPWLIFSLAAAGWPLTLAALLAVGVSVGPMIDTVGPVAFVGLLAVLAFYVWWFRVLLKTRKRVLDAGGVACERCLFDLSSLPQVGRCPECGTEYERERLVRMWRTWWFHEGGRR
jgi:uncharacterized paraquat-inducible protein A